MITTDKTNFSLTTSSGVPFDSSSFLSSEPQAPITETLSTLEQGQRRQRPLYRGARGDGTSPVPLALRGWKNGLLHTQKAFLTDLAKLLHYKRIIRCL